MPPLTSTFMPLLPHAYQGRRVVLIQTSTPWTRAQSEACRNHRERSMGARLRSPDEMRPLLDQLLPGLVRRVAFPAIMIFTGRWRLLADEAVAPDRAAACLASCRWERRAKPRVNTLGSNICFAPSTSSGGTPEAASCRDNRSRGIQQEICWRRREIAKVASGTRRMSCSGFPSSPASVFSTASVQRSSAAAESQVGMWTRW